MGPELMAVAPYIAGGASLLGTVMQMSAQGNAQDKSDAAFKANMLRDQEYQDKASNLVTKNAEQYAAPVRQANAQAATDTATQSLTSGLNAARASEPVNTVAGKVSNDYLTDNAKRTASVLQNSTDWAKLLGKQRGANDLRANEGFTNAEYAGQGGSLGADRGFMAGAGNLDAKIAGQPDGMEMMGGKLLSGVGTSLLAQNLMKKAGTSATGLPT